MTDNKQFVHVSHISLEDHPVIWIDNPEISDTLTQGFIKNDVDFHRSLFDVYHSIKTIEVTDMAEALSLGISKFIWIKKGLLNAHDFLVEILKHDTTNWATDWCGYIDLKNDNKSDPPGKISAMIDKQLNKYRLSLKDRYLHVIDEVNTKWYVTNTETKSIWIEDEKDSANEIWTTGGGLTWAIEAYINFAKKPGKINVLDNSIQALHMSNYMHKNWDGMHYAKFIREYAEENPRLAKDWIAMESLQEYSDFLDFTKFHYRWNNIIKPSNLVCVKIDIIRDSKKLIEIHKDCKAFKNFVDYSNAYMYYPTALLWSQSERREKFNEIFLLHEQTKGTKFKERNMNALLRN